MGEMPAKRTEPDKRMQYVILWDFPAVFGQMRALFEQMFPAGQPACLWRIGVGVNGWVVHDLVTSWCFGGYGIRKVPVLGYVCRRKFDLSVARPLQLFPADL
jgi:hypothetical protein